MWMPAHGFTKRGRPKRNYIKKLTDDTGLTVEEEKTAMKDRNIWKKLLNMLGKLSRSDKVRYIYIYIYIVY